MAAPYRLLLSFFVFFFTLRISAASICPRVNEAAMIVSFVRSQCPYWIDRSPVVEVSGETIEKELANRKNGYYSILFYASWCPFSQMTQHLFDALSFLFPGVHHLAVEESSAMPSMFSRYGVHSFPSIFICNSTTRVRYRGSKDLISLLLFYMKHTGLQPVAYFPGDRPFDLVKTAPVRAHRGTIRKILNAEPYLALALLFLFFRAFIYISPAIWSKVKAYWDSRAAHSNMALLGGWGTLLERVNLMFDLKKELNKFKIIRKRNFCKGASNARVWASSLTSSVSLGESGSSRSVSSSSSSGL